MRHARDSLLGSALLLAASAQADTLQLQRAGANGVGQQIEVTSWRYSADSQTLRIITADGDRQCGASGVKAGSGPMTLIIDGNVYAALGFDESKNGIIRVDTGGTAANPFPACISGSKGSGALDNAFTIDTLTAGTPISDIGTIEYTVDGTLPNGKLAFTNTQELICVDTGGNSNQPVLEITDVNDVVEQFVGAESITFDPSNNRLAVTTGDNINCVVPPAPLQVRLGEIAVPEECSQTVDDRIFAGGFGDTPTVFDNQVLPPGVDLQLALELDQNPTLQSGSDEPAIHRLVIRNCGRDRANNVVVKSLFPNGPNAPAPRFTGTGDWELQSASQSQVEGDGYVDAAVGAINGGEVAVIEAERRLLNDAANQIGQLIKISAFALDTTRADRNLLDNIVSRNVEVLNENNQIPLVTVTGQANALDEDSPQTVLGGVTIVVSDADPGSEPEGQIASVTATASSGIVSVNAANLNDIQLIYTPALDFFGDVTINVFATDGGGATSDAGVVNLTLNPINDMPSFEVQGGFAVDFGAGNPPWTFATTCPDGDQTGCADQTWPAELSNLGGINVSENFWIFSSSAGPANESDQTVTFSLALDPDSDNLWAGFNGAPQLDTAGGNNELMYSLNGSSGTATVTLTAEDGAGGQASITFDITVENNLPQICAAGSVVGNCAPISAAALPLSEDLNNLCVAENQWVLKTSDNSDNIDDCESNTGGDNFVFTVVDAENDPIVDVEAVPVDGSIFLDGLDIINLGNNNYSVSVPGGGLAADVFGPTSFTLRARDTAHAETVESDPVNVDIRGVNDQPTVVFNDNANFAAAGVVFNPTGGTGGIAQLVIPVGTSQVSIDNFVLVAGDGVVGPLEGGSQLVSAIMPTGGTDVVQSAFAFASGGALGLSIDSAAGSQDFDVMTFTLTDNGGTDFGGVDLSAPVQLEIFIQ